MARTASKEEDKNQGCRAVVFFVINSLMTECVATNSRDWGVVFFL